MEFQSIDNYFEYDSEELEVKRKYLVLVIYDVIDDRRRAKLAKFLNRYGVRVQRSAFECILDKKHYLKLLKNIEKYIASDDLLRVYKLYGSTDVRTWGRVGKTEDEDVIII